MRFFSVSACFFFTLIPAIFSSPLHDTSQDDFGVYQTVEAIQNVPFGWTYQSPATNDEILNLQLVVKTSNEQNLGNKLMQISTPNDENYGNHLTKQQLSAFVTPRQEDLDLVISWLSSFSEVQDIKYQIETSSISFKSTVAAAADMFRADFGNYEANDGGKIIRSMNYSLPEEIRRKTVLVHPITYFHKPNRSSLKASEKLEVRDTIAPRQSGDSGVLAACSAGIYPACIAKMYNIDYTPPTNTMPSGSMLGVTGFLEMWINHTDVTSFIAKYGNSATTRANPGNFTVELVNGGINDESSPGIEPTLDMEYSMPFTGSLPVVFYSTGGRPPSLDTQGNEKPLNETNNEPYLEFLQYMLAKADSELPQVISISYTDTEQTVPPAYAAHVCDLFGRLAARGVSIINASGDGGVAGQEDVPCISNDGQNRTTFLPTFPASCPWVTAVGSTSTIPEQGSDFSSGGFSNYFAVPDYQRNSTSAYIDYLDGQYTGLYNASGRGIPDVAFYGSRYETENNNVTSGHHSGTSAGTPVFAAMIALVNDIRLREGKSVLGWLNPLLYSEEMKGVFNDITEGVSFGCAASWNATDGWDTVTGLGSLDFRRLVSVAA